MIRSERNRLRAFVSSNAAIDSRYASDTLTEFDLMAVAAENAFGVSEYAERTLCGCDDLTRECPVWMEKHATRGDIASVPGGFQHDRMRSYSTTSSTRVHVLGASTGRPPARPNTADTYRLLADVASFSEGQSAVVVTTQVFVPFQTFDALRMLYLPHGVEVTAVGFGFERGDRPMTPEFELQEVLSGIRSARRLATSVLGQPN